MKSYVKGLKFLKRKLPSFMRLLVILLNSAMKNLRRSLKNK